MNGFHRCPRRLSAVLLVSLGAGVAQAQLNDTGQQTCYDNTAAADCATVAVDMGTHPRQDARFGRDAAATAGVLPKTGGGAAGFDFTPLAADGSEIPLTGNPPVPSATPACIRDNHANLIWEVKTDDGGFRDKDWTYTWYDGSTGDQGTTGTCGNTLGGNSCNTQNYIAAVNTPPGLCGYPSGWRLPTTRELLSIVHNGTWNPPNPVIDINYFPNTVGSFYWSADTYAPIPALAWLVDFGNGVTDIGSEDGGNHVRLVRSGQSFDPSDLLGSLITANASPAGGGTVSCAPNPVTPFVPGGLSASTSTSTCTATPNYGYYFGSWSGDCAGDTCELTNVTAPKSVTAIFYVQGGGGGGEEGGKAPAVGLWGLGLLAGLLAGLGGFQLRRGRRVRR